MHKELLTLIQKVDSVREAAKMLEGARGLNVFGLSGVQKTVFAAALSGFFRQPGPLVFMLAGRDEVRDYRRELNYFFPGKAMYELFPENLTEVKADAKNQEVAAARVMALRAMKSESFGIIFVTAEALLQKLPAAEAMLGSSLFIRIGEEAEQKDIIAKLVSMGYERTEQVDTLGQFCLRGDIMDIYPINESDPVRIEWFDNVVDAVRSFDLKSQRALESRSLAEIVAMTGTSRQEDSAVFSYLATSAHVFVDEPLRFSEMLRNLYGENGKDLSDFCHPSICSSSCRKPAASACRLCRTSTLTDSRQ